MRDRLLASGEAGRELTERLPTDVAGDRYDLGELLESSSEPDDGELMV
jgi:hypothetical protein